MIRTVIKKKVLLDKNCFSSYEERSELLYSITDVIKQNNIPVTLNDYELTLVVDEAITNAMEHGNHWDADKSVYASVWIDERFLHIEIEDDGEGFDYKHFKSDCAKGNKLSDRGRGIIILNNLCVPVWKKKEGRLR
jgi:serine/threonine-protein kinase RsbW